MSDTFDHLIFIGRPASGKSELIDFIKNTSIEDRVGEFHIGGIEEIDDFPWIYQKFKEDDIWEAAGYDRLYSRPISEKVYATADYSIYDFTMGKFSVEIKKRYLQNPSFYEKNTLFIEFSRGQEDGYRRAFSFLDKELLKKSAVINIFVSYEEACRRNLARSSKKSEQGILNHMVPEEVMERLYRVDDWLELTGSRESGRFDVGGLSIPFVTMKNDPELPPGPEIAERYKSALNQLWKIYSGGRI